jgi:hypothetical protein
MGVQPLRNDLLIGQIALELGLVSQEQLKECLTLQSGQAKPRPVGEVLVSAGYLTPEQLAVAAREQERRLSQSAEYAEEAQGSALFGRVLVRLSLATPERINEALGAQQDLAERGIRKRLGQILIEAGHLEPEALRAALKRQEKVVLACPACGMQANVLVMVAEGYPCRKCGRTLEAAADPTKADETSFLLPPVRADVPPRPSSTRIALPAPTPAPPPPAPPAPARAPGGSPARVLWLALLLALLALLLLVYSRAL